MCKYYLLILAHYVNQTHFEIHALEQGEGFISGFISGLILKIKVNALFVRNVRSKCLLTGATMSK